MAATHFDRDAAGPEELARTDLREAYERGRRDERASRRRHPVAMTLTVIAALVGVVVMALAAVNGSFTRAGGVVDQNLATAATKANRDPKEVTLIAVTGLIGRSIPPIMFAQQAPTGRVSIRLTHREV